MTCQALDTCFACIISLNLHNSKSDKCYESHFMRRKLKHKREK